MSEKNQHHGNKWMPVLYATYYGILKDIAEKHGYALAIHGTLSRDLDLILVPWVEEPDAYFLVLKEFKDAICGPRAPEKIEDSADSEKPHNRVAYTIQSGGGGYLDISVIKPQERLKSSNG